MLCAKAGLRPWELDDKYLCDLWVVVEGMQEHLRDQWEMTRALGFIIHQHSEAKHKKGSPQSFWPMAGDEQRGSTAARDIALQELKRRKQANGSQ